VGTRWLPARRELGPGSCLNCLSCRGPSARLAGGVVLGPLREPVEPFPVRVGDDQVADVAVERDRGRRGEARYPPAACAVLCPLPYNGTFGIGSY
jgi:hypothetical protein